MLEKSWVNKIWLVALILAPIVLWVLPANFFDHGGPVLCPSKLFFNVECFGCGMTRAIMHFHHFDFENAIFYNSGCLFIYPGLVVIWGIWTLNSCKRLGYIKQEYNILGLLD